MPSNPECYAHGLGDCRGPVSGEHVVSDSLLQEVWQGEKGGRVHGLSFLKHATPENPALIGIAGLTAKILCKGHNSDLSPFDTEITKLFRAKERLLMAEMNGEPCAETTYVNGDKIERWMLKTLFNGVFSGTFGVPFEKSFKGQVPHEHGLQILYRDAPFPSGQGLYVSFEGQHVNADHVLNYAVVGHPSGVVGLRVWMLGSLFTLVLTDDPDAFPDLPKSTYRPSRIITSKTSPLYDPITHRFKGVYRGPGRDQWDAIITTPQGKLMRKGRFPSQDGAARVVAEYYESVYGVESRGDGRTDASGVRRCSDLFWQPLRAVRWSRRARTS